MTTQTQTRVQYTPFHAYFRTLHRVAEGRAGYERPENMILGEPKLTEEYQVEAVCHAYGHDFWRFEGVVEHYDHCARMVGFLIVLASDGEELGNYPYERMLP